MHIIFSEFYKFSNIVIRLYIILLSVCTDILGQLRGEKRSFNKSCV